MFVLLRGLPGSCTLRTTYLRASAVHTIDQIYDGLLKQDDSALKKSCGAEVVKRVRLIEAEYGTLKRYSLSTFVKDPVAPYIEVKVMAYREKADSHLKVRVNEVVTFLGGELVDICGVDPFYGK